MIFQFLFALMAYFVDVGVAYYLTEVKRLPTWLQFPPFHCRKCLTFWTLIGLGVVIGLSFQWYWAMGMIIILAILTAIAMTVDQRNKTIKIEDI